MNKLLLASFFASFSLTTLAGTCKIDSTIYHQPGMWTRIHEKLGSTINRNATFQSCLEATQQALHKVRHEMAKKPLYLRAAATYSEADQFDRKLAHTEVSIVAEYVARRSMGDYQTSNKYSSSSYPTLNRYEVETYDPYAEQSTCGSYSRETVSYAKETLQTHGKEGKTFFNVNLDPYSPLTKAEQCVFSSANIYLKKFTGTKANAFGVKLSNLPLKGTKVYYTVEVTAGRPDESLRNLFLPALEKLKK